MSAPRVRPVSPDRAGEGTLLIGERHFRARIRGYGGDLLQRRFVVRGAGLEVAHQSVEDCAIRMIKVLAFDASDLRSSGTARDRCFNAANNVCFDKNGNSAAHVDIEVALEAKTFNRPLHPDAHLPPFQRWRCESSLRRRQRIKLRDIAMIARFVRRQISTSCNGRGKESMGCSGFGRQENALMESTSNHLRLPGCLS
mgnify:CR=1 FL=1